MTKEGPVTVGHVLERVFDEDITHVKKLNGEDHSGPWCLGSFDPRPWRNGLDVRVLFHVAYQAAFMEWGMTDADIARCWEAVSRIL